MRCKKINEKGFTLIELLVTITLMLSILGIAIVSFITISNRRKEQAWEQVKAQVETAAREYFTANEWMFEGLSGTAESTISVGKLVEDDYINLVVNPITGATVDECSVVIVTKDGSKLTANYSGDEERSGDECNTKSIITTREAGAPTLNPKLTCSKADKNNPWCTSTATIDPNVTDTGGGSVTITQESANQCNLSSNKKTVQCSNDGTPKVIITATNNSNGKKATAIVDVKIDTRTPDAPTIVVNGTKGNNGWYKEKSVKLSASSTCKNVSGCILHKGENSNVGNTAKSGLKKNDTISVSLYTISDTNGTTRYSKICSVAGKCSSISSSTVKVDTTKPKITNVKIVKPSNLSYNSNNAYGIFKITDDLSGIGVVTSNLPNSDTKKISWDKGGAKEWNVAGTGYPVSISSSLNGASKKLIIDVTDLAGNTASAESSLYTVYKECNSTTTSLSTSGTCGDKGYLAQTKTYKDSITTNVCKTESVGNVDCAVKSIELTLNNNDAVNDSVAYGMGGVGPNGSNGKPIFNRPASSYPAPNTLNYSTTDNCGMNVTIGWNSNKSNISYAGAACKNVGEYNRRFKYQITWNDGTSSVVRYITLQPNDNLHRIFTAFNDRNTPLSLSIDDINQILQKGCKDSSDTSLIDVNNCVKERDWQSRDSYNVTTHVYRISTGNTNSNNLTLYTKYFAECGY